MKKFLLSLATVLCAGAFANAAETTFTFYSASGVNNYGLTPAYTNSNTGYISNGSKVTEAPITLTLNGAQKECWRNWSDGLRAYGKTATKKPTLTVSGEDVTITKVSFSLKSAMTIAADAGEMEKTTSVSTNSWTGSAEDVTFTITGANAAIQVLTITYEAVGPVEVEAPEFSVEEGIYTSPVSVGISTKTEGCKIYYTTDGTTPSDASTLYDGTPIEISKYTQLAAIAFNADDVASFVTKATYAFQNTEATAMTVAEALAWIADGEDDTTDQYVAGTITAITEVSSQYGNATYYIADAGNNAETLYVYRGRYLNNEGFTSDYVATDPDNCQIKVGDDVIIYGNLMNFKGDSPQIGQGNYIVKLVTTGVEGIEIEENNAPVEYFNLQGVRVDNPANGLYIMRQGDKVTKVIK